MSARSPVHWTLGDEAVRGGVEAWLRGEPVDAIVLADSSRRQLARLVLGDGRAVLVKGFRGPARRGLRRLADRLGRHPAGREWRCLRRLSARGLPVPRPLARARRGDDEWLVLEFRAGDSLLSLRSAPRPERRRRLAEVGRALAALHGAGVAHRDLHAGNVLLAPTGPVLLDFQRAGSIAIPGARWRDLGALDFSLRHHGFGAADRLVLRREALREKAPGERAALRRVGRASERRANAYYRSRTRRSLRSGRRFAGWRGEGERGLRARELDPGALRIALSAHDRAGDPGAGDPGRPEPVEILKLDHRARIVATRAGDHRVVVKEVLKPGFWRRIADVFRGSPARRAFRAGHGLACRGIGAARPLAFVERRRLGVPIRSRVVLEDLRPARPASDPAVWQPDPERAVAALDRLVRSLHRHRIAHGDLQALHVYLASRDGDLAPSVIDLEGVRFGRRLSDRQRRRALAELNASLPESFVSAADRRAWFERYARAFPFREGAGPALRRVVRQSLERGHAWSGDGCQRGEGTEGGEGAEGAGAPPSPSG